jgi:hypothetical protein
MTKTIILTILFVVSTIIHNSESVCISKQETTTTNTPTESLPMGAEARVAGANIKRKSTTAVKTTEFNCASPPKGMCVHGWVKDHFVTCTFDYDEYGCWNGCVCVAGNWNGKVSVGANFANPVAETTIYYEVVV